MRSCGQKQWAWHNLRHRRASIWANGGMSTLEIMQRRGHNNISTTMGYLRLLGFTRA
ncbi:MAG: site-specific integrase [Nitrospirae bacterium]|nr:site-specific integrase [Nitrospirota bacterium]